jgi:hypothetical protein
MGVKSTEMIPVPFIFAYFCPERTDLHAAVAWAKRSKTGILTQGEQPIRHPDL